jgi:hypothetical protein
VGPKGSQSHAEQEAQGSDNAPRPHASASLPFQLT